MKQLKLFIKFSLNSKLAFVLSLEIILSVLISLASLYLFLKIGHEVLDKDILQIDRALTNFIYSFRSPSVTSIMMHFTFLGNAVTLFVLSLIMIFYIGTIRKKDAVIYTVILYSGVLLNLILKYIYQRPRPNEFPLIHENTLSFPSGHAMNSFVFFAALSYFIFRETRNVKITFIISILSVIIIGFIGLSRIYLGVHYPSDVVGGYAAGFLWFVSAILFEKIIIVKRLYKSNKK